MSPTTRSGPVPGQPAPRRSPRPVTVVLLAGSFVLALFPAFHWHLGSAATAMSYLLGTAAFITLTIVAGYVLDRRGAEPASDVVAGPLGVGEESS